MHVNFEIHLLGGFVVRLNGQPLRAFRTAKTRALLVYLAMQPDQEQSRVKLATLLWGALPETAAKTNLRIELSNLKNVLSSHPALTIERNSVCFHGQMATTDVQLFHEGVNWFLALPVESQSAELPRLAAAIDLYQGEFLAGFQLNDAIEFEDWQLLTREHLHEQMMLALNTLQTRYAQQGLWVEVAEAARRQLAIVPWTEPAHLNLIQALAAQGQTEAALAQYEKCCEILQEELGVEPSLPTRELAARLRGSAAPLALQHNLAQQTKSFVGRREEIAHLGTLVRGEKLVTLLGIGGVGKSHLAQAVAQNALHDFAGGVWFVPLANIEAGEAAAERIALAIAAAVGFAVTDLRAPLAELARYLSSKQMLLVLDNCEHVVDAVGSVLYDLLNQTAVHILATSRVRLMVEGENLLQLEGLPTPEAYTLFVDRARRVAPTFSAEGDNAELAAGVYRICEQVAGLPLGIELAASWAGHHSVAEIGRSIAQIAVQPQQVGGLVSRHHKLSGVFEYSWQLLHARHQRIMARLSLFRGGFDRIAAAAVAEGTLSDLSTLIAHSLVQRVAAGRYDLHPLLQEFAGEKLMSDHQETLYAHYSRHYLNTLMSTEHAQLAPRLLIDFENIRRSWQHAVYAGDDELVQQALKPFGEFVNRFGLISDGHKLFADAAVRFEADPKDHELVAELLDQQALFARGLHGRSAVILLQERVLTLSTRPQLQISSHLDLANAHTEVAEWEQADFHFDQAEVLAEELSDLGMYISSVEERIHLNAIHFRGDFAQGIARLEELLLLLERATSPIVDAELLRARLLQSISLIAIRFGDYALAIRYSMRAIDWANDVTYRPRKIHILVDLALAEQFAGMYAEATAHNLESLAMSEEIGDVDEIGLLKANLCMTLRQSGDLEQALTYGLEAIEILKSLSSKRLEGQARNRVGHTLSVLARWAEAYDAYGDALVVWETLQHPNRYEAMAGRAVAAYWLGKADEALTYVKVVLDFVAAKGLLGIVEPARLLLNCEAVLSGLGHVEQARQTLLQAEAWMQMIAGRISDEAIREAFLHNRPDNQLLRARIASLA